MKNIVKINFKSMGQTFFFCGQIGTEVAKLTNNNI